MGKSRIIKELVNGDISLEVALNRLLIIASDINNDELAKWAEKELNGYNNGEDVPDYRVIKDRNTLIQYSGINGRFQVTNAPLPLQSLLSGDPELFYVKVSDGISSIKLLAKGEPNKQAIKDLTWAAGTVYKLSGIQCTSIQQIIPQNALENILNSIRTNLLNIFIKLEKEYGNIDDLDIYLVENASQNNIISNNSNRIVSKKEVDDLDIIQKENPIKRSIHIGNNNKIINSNIGKNIKLDLASEKVKEKWYEKILWKLIIPIVATVISAAIIIWLGLK